MAVFDLVSLSSLMDDGNCFAFVRQHRWPDNIQCPACDNDAVIRDGNDDTQPSSGIPTDAKHTLGASTA